MVDTSRPLFVPVGSNPARQFVLYCETRSFLISATAVFETWTG
jgi:hypothetical protein